MGIKRSRPLMIDSHSTFSGNTKDVNSVTDSLLKHRVQEINEDEEEDEEQQQQQQYEPVTKQKRLSSSFDHDYVQLIQQNQTSMAVPIKTKGGKK